MSRKVVILTMTGAVDELIDALNQGDGVTVTVVSAGLPTNDDAAVVRVPTSLSTAGTRARRALWRTAIGRNAFRLTPWDGSRRFHRAIRSNAAVQNAFVDADLIVAAERDTAYAAWKAVHGRRAAAAQTVYGAVSAMAVVDGWHTGNEHTA